MPQSKDDKRNKAIERLMQQRKGLQATIAELEKDMRDFENNIKSLPASPGEMRHRLTIARRDLEYVTLEIDTLVSKTIPLSGGAAILQRSDLKSRRSAYTLEQHLTDMETYEGGS